MGGAALRRTGALTTREATEERVEYPVLPRVVPPRLSALGSSAFRDVMANMVAPVAVITAAEDGAGSGATVSAVMSLSMDPEMIVVALDRSSTTLSVVRRTRRFGVNILAADQPDLAKRFGSKADDKFSDVAWSLEAGLPRLSATSGWVRCSVGSIQDGGDHVLVSGLVEASAHDRERDALAYRGRALSPHRAH